MLKQQKVLYLEGMCQGRRDSTTHLALGVSHRERAQLPVSTIFSTRRQNYLLLIPSHTPWITLAWGVPGHYPQCPKVVFVQASLMIRKSFPKIWKFFHWRTSLWAIYMPERDSCEHQYPYQNKSSKTFPCCLHVRGIHNRKKNQDKPICFPQSLTSAWLLIGQGVTGLKFLQSPHDLNGLNIFQKHTIERMICLFGRLTALFMQCFCEKGVCFLLCITVNYVQ